MDRTVTRRDFLRSGLSATAALVSPAWGPTSMALVWGDSQSPAGAASSSSPDVLVTVFLRGGADALNIVVPHQDASYYRHRRALAIPRPDDSRVEPTERAIDLDGFFGLHPALAPLMPAWKARQLAVVHACGSPDPTKSHFEAMDHVERGVAAPGGPASGWTARMLATDTTPTSSPLRAVAIGDAVPLSLRGAVAVTAVEDVSTVRLAADPATDARLRSLLGALYEGDNPLERAGREALQALGALSRLDPGAPPAAGAAYPDSDFGRALRQVALLVRARAGLRAAAIDLGGWDTHFAQGGATGQMAHVLSNLAASLAAFRADLGPSIDSVTVVVMSEFGRRVPENASLGTDHGHGSLMLLLGGGVVGGRVHGRWPGLAVGALTGPGDLAVTTDFRDVLGEICAKRLGNNDSATIFPGHSMDMPGVIAG